jgi:hypothetical protein
VNAISSEEGREIGQRLGCTANLLMIWGKVEPVLMKGNNEEVRQPITYRAGDCQSARHFQNGRSRNWNYQRGV